MLFLANALSNICPADAKHFYMAVGKVFPVVEGKSAVDVNVEQAACGVRFLVVGEALWEGLQFAEPAAQLDLHPARQGSDELDDFEVEQQPIAHSASSSGRRPSRRSSSSRGIQRAGSGSSSLRASSVPSWPLLRSCSTTA